jgi:hypothetical protein
MKKVIILVGLLSAFTIQAETFQRVQVTGLLPVVDMYAAFEITTPKYEKVILDCQSFINGMTFYNNKKTEREIKMVDYGTCEDVYDFISQSIQDKKSVCMEIGEEKNTLSLSNDEAAECQ